MSEINSWTDINWYSLGTLLIQVAFLVAGVWFASNLLRLTRAFQEQIGALLKLWITSDPQSTAAHTRRHIADLSQYWHLPTDRQPTDGVPRSAEGSAGWVEGAWHRLVVWLQEPMYSMQVSMWRRFVGWLQAPSGS
jgi:hypothetical protein